MQNALDAPEIRLTPTSTAPLIPISEQNALTYTDWEETTLVIIPYADQPKVEFTSAQSLSPDKAFDVSLCNDDNCQQTQPAPCDKIKDCDTVITASLSNQASTRSQIQTLCRQFFGSEAPAKTAYQDANLETLSVIKSQCLSSIFMPQRQEFCWCFAGGEKSPPDGRKPKKTQTSQQSKQAAAKARREGKQKKSARRNNNPHQPIEEKKGEDTVIELTREDFEMMGNVRPGSIEVTFTKVRHGVAENVLLRWVTAEGERKQAEIPKNKETRRKFHKKRKTTSHHTSTTGQVHGVHPKGVKSITHHHKINHGASSSTAPDDNDSSHPAPETAHSSQQVTEQDDLNSSSSNEEDPGATPETAPPSPNLLYRFLYWLMGWH
ncbi:hypothetical protein [Endozoicomonas lisbonensis]|uniref:hypothetical protein n=1 Tax=Endozoicomonas lisbonensis TaxID=3120522 RepID=UPI00339196DB